MLLTPLRLPDVGGRYSSTMSAVDYNPRRQERRLTRWPWFPTLRRQRFAFGVERI